MAPKKACEALKHDFRAFLYILTKPYRDPNDIQGISDSSAERSGSRPSGAREFITRPVRIFG